VTKQSHRVGNEIASRRTLAMTTEGKRHCEEAARPTKQSHRVGNEIASQKALAMTSVDNVIARSAVCDEAISSGW
jgi:hypothetical protein